MRRIFQGFNHRIGLRWSRAFWAAFSAALALLSVISILAPAWGQTAELPQAPMASVLDVRVAAHPDGTTRLVLDLNRAINYSIQPVEQGFAIDLPKLEWRPANTAMNRSVGVMKSYQFIPADPFSANPRLLLLTNTPASVRKAFIIPPRPDDGNFRLVIDLAAGSSKSAKSYGGLPPDAIVANPKQTVSVPVAPTPPVPALAPAPIAPSPVKPIPVGMPAAGAARTLVHKPDERPAPKAERPAPKASTALPIVVIDPGHGGIDPGTIGLSGIYEKNIVLALALALKAKLDKDGKVIAMLTRADDTFIPLRERVAKARAAHADLFMSLHADSEADSQIHGLSVYTLSQNASDTEAQALADKENKADIVAGLDLSKQSPDVTNILIDLAQRETMNQSAFFANMVVDAVDKETHQVLPHTHRFAGFAVLKAPDVPSVLIETGYLSNQNDEQMLRKPDYRAKLAASLARAVEFYFSGARGQHRP